MSKYCALCLRETDLEQPPLLTVGGYGTPRYLCEECASDIDIATKDKEYDSAIAAMDRVAKKMATAKTIEDEVSVNAIREIFSSANERAEKIRDGIYDFSEDEQSEEDSFEITEEYAETEEDKELDRIDAEKQRRFDKIYGWVAVGVLALTVGFLIYRFLF